MTRDLVGQEHVLWSGTAGARDPWYRRTGLLVQWALFVVVFGGLLAWNVQRGTVTLYLGFWVLLFALNMTFSVLRAKERLTYGQYTVTNRRVLVDGRVLGVAVRRSENLEDLQAPTLWNDESVSFGRPVRGADAGRYSGVPVKPLVLYRIEQPERVLELIRQAQPPVVG